MGIPPIRLQRYCPVASQFARLTPNAIDDPSGQTTPLTTTGFEPTARPASRAGTLTLASDEIFNRCNGRRRQFPSPKVPAWPNKKTTGRTSLQG